MFPPVTEVMLISPEHPPAQLIFVVLLIATETGSVCARLKPVDLIESKSNESTTVATYEIFEGIFRIVFVLAEIRTPALSQRYSNGPIPPT